GYAAAEVEADDADPRLATALSEVGSAVRAADWPRVFALIDAAFADGLRHPFFHRLRALRAQQEGRLDEAIADFEAAIAASPGDFATLNTLGLCLAQSGRTVEGLARLDNSIALNPAFAAAHFNRGSALEALGEAEGARRAYARAVEIEPGHAQARAALAAIVGQVGEPKRVPYSRGAGPKIGSPKARRLSPSP
ncbi:MAG: tetratricopeptide repeat protein, partial [Caulobacteraceae bacterium]